MKKIVQLTPSDIGVTADLFCDCFIDDHYFSRQFKNRVGKSPREYLKTITDKQEYN